MRLITLFTVLCVMMFGGCTNNNDNPTNINSVNFEQDVDFNYLNSLGGEEILTWDNRELITGFIQSSPNDETALFILTTFARDAESILFPNQLNRLSGDPDSVLTEIRPLNLAGLAADVQLAYINGNSQYPKFRYSRKYTNTNGSVVDQCVSGLSIEYSDHSILEFEFAFVENNQFSSSCSNLSGISGCEASIEPNGQTPEACHSTSPNNCMTFLQFASKISEVISNYDTGWCGDSLLTVWSPSGNPRKYTEHFYWGPIASYGPTWGGSQPFYNVQTKQVTTIIRTYPDN